MKKSRPLDHFGNAELAQYLKMGVSSTRAKLLVQASFWIAAVVVGVAAVYFTRWIELLQKIYLGHFGSHPYLISLLTPLSFLAATGVCRYLEPHAGGSGIPQVLYAVHLSAGPPDPLTVNRTERMLSIRMSIVKLISCSLAFVGGGSIGGEGPTVQISASIFSAFGKKMKRYFPYIDVQSYLVAGAGAGIAAAFNTPLGGLVFALEEVASREFGGLKHMVMIAVIVAGMAARALLGNELYFGYPHLSATHFQLVGAAAAIGVIGGLLGGAFGRMVISDFYGILNRFRWWSRALLCGCAVSVIGLIYSGTTAGSGYAITRAFYEGHAQTLPALTFPVAKAVATALSNLSGLGGGLLAPSLSIGAWMGVSIASLGAKLALLLSPQACAVLGMVAYFSGAFQIPMTAVIVVMEMTNEHDLIFPMMIAAVFAFATAKLLMPRSLYHSIIEKVFKRSLEEEGHPKEA